MDRCTNGVMQAWLVRIGKEPDSTFGANQDDTQSKPFSISIEVIRRIRNALQRQPSLPALRQSIDLTCNQTGTR